MRGAIRTSLPAALISTLAVCVLLLCASSASALDKYKYAISMHPAVGISPADGTVLVFNFDTSKTVTVKVVRSGVTQYSSAAPAGTSSANFAAATVTTGDEIQVEQPSGTLQETFTVPDVSATGTPGTASASGHAPTGTTAFLYFSPACFSPGSDVVSLTPTGGNFATALPGTLAPGSQMTLTDHPGKGDSVRYETYVPGETPCISAYASTLPPRPTETPDATPYSVQASGLRGSVVLGARLVLRRAGVIIADASSPSTNDNISADLASPPIPGDVIELYRPQTATTPVATYVLPSVKATYDPSNSLFALDAPAASYIGAYTRQLDFNSSASRGAIDTAAGRTLLNFAAADGDESPSNLALADAVYADWFSADNVHRFEVAAVRGDLAPPVLSVKLGSKFKLAKIGSSIPATVSSNEVASAKLTLTLPAKLKTSSAKKKPKGPTTIASASGSLIAGSAKFKLKLTKSGKKLIKKLRAAHGPTQKATLTVTAVDSSGNASTKVKTTKLVAK